MGLGTACFETGRLDEAVEHFTRALALSPDAIDAMCSLAQALAAQGRVMEAEAQLERALARARVTDARSTIPQIEAALEQCRAQTRRPQRGAR